MKDINDLKIKDMKGIFIHVSNQNHLQSPKMSSELLRLIVNKCYKLRFTCN